jgi:hypothetical protein
MKKLILLVPFVGFLLSTLTAHARLDETAQEIEARYGKPLKGVKAESPAS